EAATGKPIGPRCVIPLPPEPESGWRAVHSHGGKAVLFAADKDVRLWDLLTGKPAGPVLAHPKAVNAMALGPDGRTAFTASDKETQLWNAVTGERIGPPLVHPREVDLAAFSPDGRTALTVSSDWVVRFWESATGKPAGHP